MKAKAFFRGVKPILSVIAVIVTAGLLVAAIVFSEMGSEWAIFLTGVLVAATLSMASRASQAEWTIALRNGRLKRLQEKLAEEQHRRHDAEIRFENARLPLDLVESLPGIKVLLVGRDGNIRLHNQAVRDWLGLRQDLIQGKGMRELLGDKVCDALAEPINRAMAGEVASIELMLSSLDGGRSLSAASVFPHQVNHGPVDGAFILLMPVETMAAAAQEDERGGDDQASAEQALFVEAFSEEISGSESAVERILNAIEHNEFRLFCQTISPLADPLSSPVHYEILIRLIEEEEGMMAPGAFFPLVEKFGLMPQLDRWVVEHSAKWASAHRSGQHAHSTLFINLSASTLNDPEFPAFVGAQVERYGLMPGTLCFEIANFDLAANHAAAGVFAKAVRRHGCQLALSGFGRDGVSFETLRGCTVDYLKIDGSIILDILRDPMDLARVAAITRVARTIDVKTVAELVESEECIAKLRELHVDFAQGFGISRPCALDEIR